MTVAIQQNNSQVQQLEEVITNNLENITCFSNVTLGNNNYLLKQANNYSLVYNADNNEVAILYMLAIDKKNYGGYLMGTYYNIKTFPFRKILNKFFNLARYQKLKG